MRRPWFVGTATRIVPTDFWVLLRTGTSPIPRPAVMRSMRLTFTRRQWRSSAVSAVRPHLRSDEALLRIVRAASVGRVWSLASTELMFILTIAGNLAHFLSRTVGLLLVTTLLLASEVALLLTKHRSIFVTNERILMFDSGYLAREPTKRLVRESIPDGATDIPAKRWRRFTSLGEPLYFLASEQFNRAEVVGPGPATLPTLH
jgi:hypothetical protein